MYRFLTATAVSYLMVGAAFGQTSVTGSGNVTGGAGVTVDGGGVSVGGTAGANAGAGADVGDTTVTGSTSGSASGSSTAAADSGFINQLGDNVDEFFTGENNGQLRPDAEITTNFGALPADQQARIRSQCTDLDSSQTNNKAINDFCAKIKSM